MEKQARPSDVLFRLLQKMMKIFFEAKQIKIFFQIEISQLGRWYIAFQGQS